jgi:uncharacterized membrane protein (DUF4010 family)
MRNIIILILITTIIVSVKYLFGLQSLVPFASAFALVSVAVGVWLSLQQYSLKLKSEKVEADIKLMTLFTKIMSIAHARGGYTVSEKIIEKIFDNEVLTEDELKDSRLLNEKLTNAAILTTPVGVAEQDAAIAAIAQLAKRHEVLKEVAIEGLISIKSFKKDLAEKYIKELTQD